jgi:hypothetical protein
MEKIKNEHIKEIIAVKGKPGSRKTTMVRPRQKDVRGEKKKRTSKKNVDGKSTSGHDNKKFRTRSVEKQGEMAFVFRKKAAAVIKPDR